MAEGLEVEIQDKSLPNLWRLWAIGAVLNFYATGEPGVALYVLSTLEQARGLRYG